MTLTVVALPVPPQDIPWLRQEGGSTKTRFNALLRSAMLKDLKKSA